MPIKISQFFKDIQEMLSQHVPNCFLKSVRRFGQLVEKTGNVHVILIYVITGTNYRFVHQQIHSACNVAGHRVGSQ